MTYRTQTQRPASPAQVAYLRSLIAQREVPASVKDMDVAAIPARQASALIDTLRMAPYASKGEATAKATPGYYVQGDDVYVVVENKAKTSTYAKRMVVTGNTGRWEYAPGVGRTLAGLEPLTVARAATLGRLHGVCMVCGRTLTDPESVERGIGPVCAGRLG
jgi:hypothetical protein